MQREHRRLGWVFLCALALAGAAHLIGSGSTPQFTVNDKAFYADQNLVNFVRPGLIFKIAAAEIAADGTITARVKVTDPRGLGLDRLGVVTPGAITMSFVVATIPAGQTQYVSYITRTRTDAASGRTAIQATGESTGTFTATGDGEYTYRFAAKAPANVDRKATHAIGVYGSRNLSEFDLPIDRDDDVFVFVPDGSPVTVTRDVVSTASCNRCHDPLAIHGGNRRSMELCVMCHTPQTSDAVSGNTVDMKVMTHKIHAAKILPSVVAGGKYFIGNADYSEVGFPAYPDARNCSVCHEPNSTAKQKDAHLTRPSRAACGSCHDNVNFATGVGHVDLPQTSDNQCANCHTPQGELEFDASIMGAHTIARFSQSLPGVVFDITGVTGAAPNARPTVTFSVKNKKGEPVDASKMAQLRLYIIGPTTDYYGIPPAIDARTATAKGNGVYEMVVPTALAATAKGSYSVSIQGYNNVTLLEGTQKQQDARDIGLNKTRYFSVDGTPVVARRKIVDTAKCNVCHVSLQIHGGSRNDATEFCSACHNAGAATTGANGHGLAFSQFIHRIHRGEELTYDFIFGNTNFREVVYPGDLRNCDKCHVNGSQQLPLPAGARDVLDPNGPLTPIGPTAAACTGCHTSQQAVSHGLAMTSTLGESCSVCHGPNADTSVNRSHAR